MKLTAKQLDVVRRAKRQARRKGATYTETLALVSALGVESNYTELAGGDRDSTGALQQRPSQGWGPVGESLEKDVSQFLKHARQYRGKINDPGALAQAVQRSAFPDRYGQRLADAKRALRSVGPRPDGPTAVGSTQFHPGGETTDNKAAMLAALMDERKGMSLLSRFQNQVSSGNFTTVTPPSVTPGKLRTTNLGQDENLSKVQRRADKIDAQKRPYLYGGGHGGDTSGPLDCSAAVSKVLGIDVRVSGEFMKWGKPGRGKNITVYSNPEHVLVEIGGHFWGTSKSNPGGGAGWIPRGQVTPAYLSRFTARHPG